LSPKTDSIICCICRLRKCSAMNCFPHLAWSLPRSRISFVKHGTNRMNWTIIRITPRPARGCLFVSCKRTNVNP
jgi:hypothetical protein